MKHLRKETYDEIYALRENRSVAVPKDWVLFKQMKNNPNDILFNIKKTSTIETAKNVQILAFLKAGQEMDSLLSVKPDINWGSFNPLHIQHMTRIPALSEMNLEADGCPDAINAKGNAFGPSWRMIVHQTRPLEAYGVYPGGQSGNPFSPFYKNMINDWVKGQYHVLRNDPSPETLRDISYVTIQVVPKNKK
jgi:penicillin amidase